MTAVDRSHDTSLKTSLVIAPIMDTSLMSAEGNPQRGKRTITMGAVRPCPKQSW